MKSFPFLSADLVGTYYYKEPDKNKVVFSSGVPVVAQQFDRLYAHIESPSQWRDLYVVGVVSDDGKHGDLQAGSPQARKRRSHRRNRRRQDRHADVDAVEVRERRLCGDDAIVTARVDGNLVVRIAERAT